MLRGTPYSLHSLASTFLHWVGFSYGSVTIAQEEWPHSSFLLPVPWQFTAPSH